MISIPVSAQETHIEGQAEIKVPLDNKDAGVNLFATGYDFIFEYPDQQRTLLVASIYQYLGIQDKYSVDEGVLMLKQYYDKLMHSKISEEEADRLLNEQCITVLSDLIKKIEAGEE